MANLASWSFSFPESSAGLLSASNPPAPTGASAVTGLAADDDCEWVGWEPPWDWDPRCPRIHTPIPISNTTSTAPTASMIPDARGPSPGRRGGGGPRRGDTGAVCQYAWPVCRPGGVSSQSGPAWWCGGGAGGGATGAGTTR